jgi:hypothetical protein
VLVFASALAGAVSVLVIVAAALALLCEVLRPSAPRDDRELPEALARFYWSRLSPLVHRPVRRFVLRGGVALVIVIAPAIRLMW